MSGEDQGASGKPDRATHEPSPSVSAVPVGIPSAIAEAEVQIGSVKLRVIHLDNGERLIDADSMHALMAALEDGTLLLTEADGVKLAKAIRS